MLFSCCLQAFKQEGEDEAAAVAAAAKKEMDAVTSQTKKMDLKEEAAVVGQSN